MGKMTSSMCNVSQIWRSISNTLSCPHPSLWSSLTVVGRQIKLLWMLCSLSQPVPSFQLYYLGSTLNPTGLFSLSPPASVRSHVDRTDDQQKHRCDKVPSLKTVFLSASFYMENLLFVIKRSREIPPHVISS